MIDNLYNYFALGGVFFGGVYLFLKPIGKGDQIIGFIMTFFSLIAIISLTIKELL